MNWLRRRWRMWKFDRALNHFQRDLPDSWKALSDEEQAAEINRVVRIVRAERAVRLTDSAAVTEQEASFHA